MGTTPATPPPADRTSTAAGTGAGTSTRAGTNVRRAVAVDMTMDEYTAALSAMPPHIAHFIEFDSSESFNPVQVLEFKQNDPLLSWWDILHMLQQSSQSVHRAAFGGVHPALDPPRRVW